MKYKNIATNTTSIKNHDVVRYVETNFKKGTLDKYIDRYEYMLKCFDVGNDYFENKELAKEDNVC